MTKQAPINSPFHAKSTALDVVAGVDLSGKYAIVTGGYSGIGVETVRALLSAGADILVPALDAGRAKEALKEFGARVAVATMDLSDLASVRKFAGDVVAAGKPVHLLINNAGVMACPETRVGDNWELQFATNHIGHFALTNELAPSLKKAKSARVVCLSSTGHKLSPIRWGDIHFTKEPYNKWVAYGQSKTANSLFAVELDARLKDDGVRAFAVHPGGIVTPLQRHLDQEEMIALGWLGPDGELSEMAKQMFKTPEQGASTTVWAATSAMLDGEGGVYCENCEIAMLGGDASPRWAEVQPYAVDKNEAARLWEETGRMIG
ncbi:MAG: SDR family NAD(P)-dependent oxidoreductase [Parvularculaceae bacterium]|nr:SDR family NAD(P)-dependent oxidoreductase [Parvularculaceae bacterium]